MVVALHLDNENARHIRAEERLRVERSHVDEVALVVGRIIHICVACHHVVNSRRSAIRQTPQWRRLVRRLRRIRERRKWPHRRVCLVRLARPVRIPSVAVFDSVRQSVAVAVAVVRIRPVDELVEVRESVAIRIGVGIFSDCRIQPVIRFPSVAHSVAVAVRERWIRSGGKFFRIGKSVSVEVSVPVIVEIPEISELPFVGKSVAVRGKSLRTGEADVYVIDESRAAEDREFVHRTCIAVHGEAFIHEDSVKVEIPKAVREVVAARASRPACASLRANRRVRDEHITVEEYGMA